MESPVLCFFDSYTLRESDDLFNCYYGRQRLFPTHTCARSLTKGEIEREVALPEDDDIEKTAYFKNGKVLLKGSTLYTYDFDTDTFNKMDSDTYERIISLDKVPSMFSETGEIAVPLEGADNDAYIALFDSNWNRVIEPIKCEGFDSKCLFDFSDDRLVVLEDNGLHSDDLPKFSVYDEKGNFITSYYLSYHGNVKDDGTAYNITVLGSSSESQDWIISFYDENQKLIFTNREKITEHNNTQESLYTDTSEKLISSNMHYSDGMFAIGMQLSGEPVYFDKEGNIPFEQIDISNVQIK